jgi:hypothetical protein
MLLLILLYSGLPPTFAMTSNVNVKNGANMSHITPKMQDCIEDCQKCHNVCIETAIHSLQKGGKYAEPFHLRLLADCAEICQTSANFMLRGSELHFKTCAVCSDVCVSCAVSCEHFKDEEMMNRCAEECRRCAESCRLMATRNPPRAA